MYNVHVRINEFLYTKRWTKNEISYLYVGINICNKAVAGISYVYTQFEYTQQSNNLTVIFKRFRYVVCGATVYILLRKETWKHDMYRWRIKDKLRVFL